MNEQYVLLTGSKNNAGDFLIKDRAKSLLTWLRPDRKLIDVDGWKPLDQSTLDVVNQSKALILMGGPALQEKMRPRVYGLTDNLSDINVPILTMGIGWYSADGGWQATHDYKLNSATLDLLARVEQSGFLSSVRDYHTLNALRCHGFSQYLMTGCPALYSKEHIDRPAVLPEKVKTLGFSLGVAFRTSNRMFRQMQEAILALRDELADVKLTVAFHHGLDKNYLNSPGSSSQLHKAQARFQQWLESESIAYKDISGSAENLKQFYGDCDMHVGYRVHAHIFMSSIGKPSVLLNEDGRGKALASVLGGVIFDAYQSVYDNLPVKALHKFGLPFDNFVPARGLPGDLARISKYELKHGIRLTAPFESLKRHFPVMKRFIEQLP